jgi:hypothetical protein
LSHHEPVFAGFRGLTDMVDNHVTARLRKKQRGCGLTFTCVAS